MLSAATRAAAGLARSLAAAAVGAAGTVVGAAVGLLRGFVNEDGLLQGALVGAVTGALVSVELADSLYYSDGLGDRDDLLAPSSPTMAARRAAVEGLPATTLTKETAAAGQQTSCPICLHEFQPGESARTLPACSHVFHLACIDSWLLWKPQCPMCRHAVY